MLSFKELLYPTIAGARVLPGFGIEAIPGDGNLKRTKMKPLQYFIGLSLLLLSLGTAILADGIDTTFNAQVQTATYSQKTVDLLLALPDGKTLAGGSFNNYNGQPVGCLIRLNADATLDQTFNNGLIEPDSDVPRVLVMPDGKILLGGRIYLSDGTTYQNSIIRITADGAIDTSFNYQAGPIWGLNLDATGRVMVWGTLQYQQGGNTVSRVFARLNEDGSVDTSFDAQPQPQHMVTMFNMQGNRLVYVAWESGIQQYRLARRNDNGSVDGTFPSTLLGGLGSSIVDIKTQPDNKILLLNENRVLRYNENGGADSTFTGPGILPNPARSLHLHNDGRMTVLHSNLSPHGARVIRLLPVGTPDPSFTPYNYSNYVNSATSALQLDEGVLLADWAVNSSSNGFMRLLPSGLPDPGFNPGGTGFQSLKPGKIRAITVLANGKILIGGDFDKVNTAFRRKIARLNDDSTLDASFQVNTTPTGDYFSEITDVYNIALQQDGKVLVSGHFTYHVNGSQKSNVVRLNTDGSIDATFVLSLFINDWFGSTGLGTNEPVQRPDGEIAIATSRGDISDPMSIPLLLDTNGTKNTSFNPAIYADKNSVVTYDIAAQANGALLFSGRHSFIQGSGDTRKGFVARLNSNGTVDTGFEIFETPNVDIFRFTVLPDGKILAVSRIAGQSTVLRLGASGGVDNTFDTGGGANGKINAIVALPSGKIVVGGLFSTYNGQTRRNIAFINADGTLGPDLGSVNREVLSLTVDNQGRLLIGGEFTSITSGAQQVNVSYVARMNLESAQSAHALFDYDGDGKTDISVYRPGTTGTWYVQRSQAGFYGLEFGGGADKIIPADYDGDGKTDIAVYRPSEGMWYRFLSATQSFTASPWGLSTDIPAPGDYDGDGRADLAIFRPSDGNWWLKRSTAGETVRPFGQNGDIPALGDYDGDGTSDIAVFRPSSGVWYINRSTAGIIGYAFGFGTDKITPADYDGDGKTDIAVFRPSTGQWFIANSGSPTYPIHHFGAPTDIPVPGDYDGDGRADVAIFRPSDGNWWIDRTTAGLTVVPFGQNGDRPTPNAFGN